MSDDNLATWAGGQLASGAVGAVGGSLFTYGLNQAGISLPGGGDPSSQLAAIQETLTQIVGMLTDIKTALGNAELRLAAAITRDDFDSGSRQIEGLIQNIVSLTTRYKDVVADSVRAQTNSDTQLMQRVADAKTAILNDIEQQLVNQPSTIHRVVAGDGATTPLYEIYAAAVKLTHRFLSFQDSDGMQARINYYQSAQYLQQMLVVTYCNAGRGLPEDGSRAIKTFQDNMAAENRFQVIPIPKGVVIDQKTGLVLYIESLQHVNGTDSWVWATQRPTMGVFGWRLPNLWQFISSDRASALMGADPPANPTPGIFTDYDSKSGSVTLSQWLINNGWYKDLGSLQLWTPNFDVRRGAGFWRVDVTDGNTVSPRIVDGGEFGNSLLIHATGSDFDGTLLNSKGDAAAASKPKPQFDPDPIAESLVRDVVNNSMLGESQLGLSDDIESRYQSKCWLYRIALVLLALNKKEEARTSVKFSAVRVSFETLAFRLAPEKSIRAAVQDLSAMFWDPGPDYHSDEEIINRRRIVLGNWLYDVGLTAADPIFPMALTQLNQRWQYIYIRVEDLLAQRITP
jgi:hypothetical protein